MSQIYETVILSKLISKLETYMQRKQIVLDPDLKNSYSKIRRPILKSYLRNLRLDVTMEKTTQFSHVASSKICHISPEESLLLLSYIVQNLHELGDEKVQIIIHGNADNQNFIDKDYLHLITNISTLGKNMKMDISKIDEKYPMNKALILGAKKSVTGTLLNRQHTKYFKPKHNKTPKIPIPIEQLVTDKKNYLKAKGDEIIVVKCPICDNKLRFNYQTIDKHLTLKKSTVILQCNHPDTTHLYTTKPYSFELPQHIIGAGSKKDVLMYVINNKAYYELSVYKTTTQQ